jgi:hypothetical protein
MKMIKGTWVYDKPLKHVPAKMTKESALEYYTNKFSRYWETDLARNHIREEAS